MKKQNLYKFFYLISIILIIGFFIRLIADYFAYNPSVTSAPFYVFIIIRSFEFLLPCLIIFITAKIIKNKFKK